MKSGDQCPQRVALGKNMAAAINRVYKLMAEVDNAKRTKTAPEILDNLYASLQAARKAELEAERAHREHRNTHGCAATGL